jgi:tetratricopeptide (TPR) repeat protein
MRSWLFVLLLNASVGVWAQNSNPPAPGSSNSQSPSAKSSDSQTPDSSSKDSTKPAGDSDGVGSPGRTPSLAPPRSDRVNVNDLGNADGMSSSQNTQIDLSPPADDTKTHPHSGDILTDAGSSGSGDTTEMHPWNPHKAAKDVEVGDFYFKRKNYVAAEDRYREALYYKENDAIATYRLAECLDKMDRPLEARTQFENYLKILPDGPQSRDAKKAIERIDSAESKTKAAK